MSLYLVKPLHYIEKISTNYATHPKKPCTHSNTQENPTQTPTTLITQ
uniref:Uncharacterized protein n=1 Tax=Rhizophora mucronata TaxID=61149 RepID=A0A2P2N7Q7_RHIMU